MRFQRVIIITIFIMDIKEPEDKIQSVTRFQNVRNKD